MVDRYRVFVSYTGEDEALARLLRIEIEARGMEAFAYKRDGQIGDQPEALIVREIAKSQEILILLTPKSFDRMYIGFEYALALANGLHVTAARFHMTYEEINHSDNIIAGLKEVQFDLNVELDRWLDELAIRAKGRSGG